MEKPKVVLFGFSGQVEKDMKRTSELTDTCSGKPGDLQLRRGERVDIQSSLPHRNQREQIRRQALQENLLD